MKQLIINADDFGLSLGVSQGIATAARVGVLTSTTIMGNMPNLSKHLDLVDGLDVGLGIHLVLTAGQPVLPRAIVPSLVDEKGFFRRDFRKAIHHAHVADVEKEWQAQVESVLALGIKPTHLDSHHHVHMAPQLMQVAISLARRYKIPALRRLPLHDIAREQGLGLATTLAPLVWQSCFKLAKSGLKYPQGLISLSKENLARMGSLKDGVYEIFCHPGLVDAELCSKSALLKAREDELALLIAEDTREILKYANCELVSYALLGIKGE